MKFKDKFKFVPGAERFDKLTIRKQQKYDFGTALLLTGALFVSCGKACIFFIEEPIHINSFLRGGAY